MRMTIVIILLLSGLCFGKSNIAHDPNENIQSPTDPNSVILTITIEISKEDYALIGGLGDDILSHIRRIIQREKQIRSKRDKDGLRIKDRKPRKP